MPISVEFKPNRVKNRCRLRYPFRGHPSPDIRFPRSIQVFQKATQQPASEGLARIPIRKPIVSRVGKSLAEFVANLLHQTSPRSKPDALVRPISVSTHCRGSEIALQVLRSLRPRIARESLLRHFQPVRRDFLLAVSESRMAGTEAGHYPKCPRRIRARLRDAGDRAGPLRKPADYQRTEFCVHTPSSLSRSHIRLAQRAGGLRLAADSGQHDQRERVRQREEELVGHRGSERLQAELKRHRGAEQD